MHFYGVYALCRLAGMHSKPAHTIAYASQFVDDAIEDANAIFRKSEKALRYVMTSHKSLNYKNAIFEDQWRVWTSFHFLPGNQSRNGKFEEKMICRKNSELAQQVLENAKKNIRKPYGLYLAGIAAHSFADTFAHYGFIGISTDWNKIISDTLHTDVRRKNLFSVLETTYKRVLSKGAEIIPVGHGSVGTYPDQPFLNWEYKYRKGRRAKVIRKNSEDYLEASKLLYGFFNDLVHTHPFLGNEAEAIDFDIFNDDINNLLIRQADKPRRISNWKHYIKSGKHFDPDEHDKRIHYKEKLWKLKPHQLRDFDNDEAMNQPLSLFMKAAQNQVELVSEYLIDREIVY